MPADKKNKTLSYRRAVFISPGGDNTLETLFTSARDAVGPGHRFNAEDDRPAIEERHHIYKTGTGHFLHVVAFTPGEEASIVPHAHSGDLATTPPPEDADFMDGDIMAMICGNDVVLCANSLHEKQLERFLVKYLDAAGINDPEQTFELSKIANVNKVKMIQDQGVKEVCFDSSLYEASFLHTERQTVHNRLTGKFFDEFRALFFQDEEPIDLVEAENLTVKLVLSYDKRKKGADFSRKKLETMANRAYTEDDEGIKIKTFNGDIVSASDITLKKQVVLNRHGKTVWYSDAWSEIEKYYQELKAGGFLET